MTATGVVPAAQTAPRAQDDVVGTALRGLFGRDSLYLLLWALQAMIAALATPFATRLLGPGQFGTVAAATALMQVLFVVGGAGLSVAVQRAFADRGADDARRLVTLSLVTAVLVTAAADLTGPVWSPALGFGSYGGPARLGVLWAGAAAVTAVLLALLRSQDRLVGYGAVCLLQSVGVEVAALVLVSSVRPTAGVFLLGRLLAQVLALGLGAALVGPRALRPVHAPLVRGALAFGLPLVPAMLGSFVLGAADRFLLQGELGAEAVARYSVAYNIAALPTLALTVLDSAWLPRIFAMGTGTAGDAVLAASRDALYRLLGPVLAGISVGAPLVFRIWAPASFRTDGLLLVTAVVVVGAVPFAAALSAARALLAASRTRTVAWAAVLAAVVNVLLNLWWIPVLGILGAALATLVAYGAQHGLLLLATRGRPRSATRTGLLTAAVGAGAALLAVLLPTDVPGLAVRGVLAVGCLGWLFAAHLGIRSATAAPSGVTAVPGAPGPAGSDDDLLKQADGSADGVVRDPAGRTEWGTSVTTTTVVRPVPAGTWCCELELAGAPELRSVVPAGDQERARVLVRLHGEPLGYLTVPMGEALEPCDLVGRARARFATRIAAHLTEEGSSFGSPIPAAAERCPNRVAAGDLVSVVVCTRDRADQLAACLERLRMLTYPHLEVVVVDNAPSDEGTRFAVAAVAAEDPRFRYVVEPRPGLSCARNRGLAEARGRYVAYTDDDVAVDPGWVQGLLRGFARRDDVACVTGLVATAGLDGSAEEYFDARAASWSTRCEPELFAYDTRAGDALFPYSPGHFGTGANLALDRALLVGIGGFDEALGAGTRTRGGEDLDLFVRVLRSGRAIAYEPAALVWHHHRADDDALLRQMFGYGTGLSAFMTKCLLTRDTRREVVRRLPVGLSRMAGIRRDTRERMSGASAPAPRGALRQEFLGVTAGPWLYLRARRQVSGAGR